jgi:hypothetical protein
VIREISVYLPNIPGQFSKVLNALASADVNIRGFSVDLAGAISELRLLFQSPRQAEGAREALREYFDTEESDLLLLSAADEPGELLRVTEILGQNDINVEYGYVALGHTEDGHVFFAIKVEKGKAHYAIDCLAEAGVPDHSELPDATPRK